jgi:DNA repair protein RadC
MDRLGAGGVPDDVLLAILLRSGVRGMNVTDLSRRLLRDYGSWTGLACAPVEDLARLRGMGRVKAQVLVAACEVARRMARESAPSRPAIRAPEDAAGLLRADVRTLDVEHFWVLRLDAKNRLKGEPEDVTSGLLDANLVHPREIFRGAIRAAAAAVVLVHNHPSGDPTPSAEDVKITRQLVEAGRILDIRVLDHVVLGKPSVGRCHDFLSLREEGIVGFD